MRDEEKERPMENTDNNEEEKVKQITVDVTIHGTYLGKIMVPEGATLSEILSVIEKKQGKIKLEEFTIMLNDKQIEFKDGKLKENPILVNGATLSLLKKIRGGK